MLKPIIINYKLTTYHLLIIYKYLQTLRILLTIKERTDKISQGCFRSQQCFQLKCVFPLYTKYSRHLHFQFAHFKAEKLDS